MEFNINDNVILNTKDYNGRLAKIENMDDLNNIILDLDGVDTVKASLNEIISFDGYKSFDKFNRLKLISLDNNDFELKFGEIYLYLGDTKKGEKIIKDIKTGKIHVTKSSFVIDYTGFCVGEVVYVKQFLDDCYDDEKINIGDKGIVVGIEPLDDYPVRVDINNIKDYGFHYEELSYKEIERTPKTEKIDLDNIPFNFTVTNVDIFDNNFLDILEVTFNLEIEFGGKTYKEENLKIKINLYANNPDCRSKEGVERVLTRKVSKVAKDYVSRLITIENVKKFKGSRIYSKFGM